MLKKLALTYVHLTSGMKALNDVNYPPSSVTSGTATFAEMIKKKCEKVDELFDAALAIFREFVMAYKTTMSEKSLEVQDARNLIFMIDT